MTLTGDVFTGNAPYEYTVVRVRDRVIRRRRWLLMLLYVAWCTVWLVGGASVFRLFAPLIALVPVSLWILIFFTWRLTEIEYDYVFFSGKLTISRVLGGRSRRCITTLELRRILSVEKGDGDAARRSAERTLAALSSPDTDRRYAILYRDENDVTTLLFAELDEKALRILRYYNAAAMKVR